MKDDVTVHDSDHEDTVPVCSGDIIPDMTVIDTAVTIAVGMLCGMVAMCMLVTVLIFLQRYWM